MMPGTSKKTYEEIYRIIDDYFSEIAEAQGKVFGRGAPLDVTFAQKRFILAKVQMKALTSEFVAEKCFANYIEMFKIRMVNATDTFEVEKVRKKREAKKKAKEEAEAEALLNAEVKTNEEKEENP